MIIFLIVLACIYFFLNVVIFIILLIDVIKEGGNSEKDETYPNDIFVLPFIPFIGMLILMCSVINYFIESDSKKYEKN